MIKRCFSLLALFVILVGTATYVYSPSVPGVLYLQDSKLIDSFGKIGYGITGQIGVNYLSLYNLYSENYTTDAILRRDFEQFKRCGINIIALSLYWYRLEGNTMGDYDGVYSDGSYYGERFLEQIKRVSTVANDCGIKVLIRFHTLWGIEDSPWCTPDYVIDPVTRENIGLAIVRSENMKKAFIDMFNHTVSYLAGTPGIWAWIILSEPWYWPHDLDPPYDGINQKENFLDLIQTLSNIVKNVDGRPATVEFVNTHEDENSTGDAKLENIFAEDWNWDRRIFDSLDFISLSVFLPSTEKLYDIWSNMTSENVIGISQHNRKVWITSFGYSSDDDDDQSRHFKVMVDLFRTLPLQWGLAFFWRGDFTPAGFSEKSDEIGKGFNLCASPDGRPRPAFFTMIGDLK